MSSHQRLPRPLSALGLRHFPPLLLRLPPVRRARAHPRIDLRLYLPAQLAQCRRRCPVPPARVARTPSGSAVPRDPTAQIALENLSKCDIGSAARSPACVPPC